MSLVVIVAAVIAAGVGVFFWLRGSSREAPPAPAARPSLQTTGELAYEVRGEGEPVLLIHGALVEDMFLPLLGEPALSGYRQILYHRRGYGGSAPLTRPFSMAEQAADACALLDYLSIERTHVVGLSGGGVTSLQLALDFPERVQSLSLLEPALSHFMSDLSWREALRFLRVRARAALGNPVGASYLFFDFAGGPNWREDVAGAAPFAPEQVERAARHFFTVDLNAVSGFEWDDSQAARISQPVLWIHGGQSVLPLETAERLVPTWFPKAEFVVVPDATHLLQMHRPRAVAEAIAGFLPKHGL